MPNSLALERHWEQNRALLVEAARNAGIDPSILVKISGFESGFDAQARPVNRRHSELNTVRQFDGTMALSSAYGLGQFTNDTWLDTIHRHGAKYGITDAAHLTAAQANAPGLRDNPRLQAAMLAEFTSDNVARGQRHGGADADANVYALHNLGSGDGPKFLDALRTNPNTPVDSVLSARVIRGNPALYGDGSRSLADTYRVMGSKMDEYSDYANRVQCTGPTPGPIGQPGSPRAEVHPTARTHGNIAIYNEARVHFLDGVGRFEYGRGDIGRLPNRGGDGRTDQSRNERDLDGDGRKGVDCSSFVWRGLRNAGYGVPEVPFTSHDLFHGRAVTPYSRQHFDVIPAGDANRDRGPLEPGDILLFQDRRSDGQHVGIFKGYDSNGHIRFIGSQTTTGPGEEVAGPGSYWNGQRFEIIGALRAKPEFQVRVPLHGVPDKAMRKAAAPAAAKAVPATHGTREPRGGPQGLEPGAKGPAVIALQGRLFELGYRGEAGKLLRVDGEFGRNTSFALKQFQREHGLEGKGVAGPKTEAALKQAEQSLMSDPSHPQHALFRQAVAKVTAAETAQGTAVGPHTERIAAALTVECLREGITHIDRVEINDRNTLVRAIENRPHDREAGLGITDMISLVQASKQPIGESSRQAHEVAVNVQARQQDHELQIRRTVPVLAH